MKSTPVTSNGWTALTLCLTSGGGSGIGYGLPAFFLQMTHVRSSDQICCLPGGIQYCRHTIVRVALTPLWCCATCVWSMTRFVKWCLDGNKYGNLGVGHCEYAHHI